LSDETDSFAVCEGREIYFVDVGGLEGVDCEAASGLGDLVQTAGGGLVGIGGGNPVSAVGSRDNIIPQIYDHFLLLKGVSNYWEIALNLDSDIVGAQDNALEPKRIGFSLCRS